VILAKNQDAAQYLGVNENLDGALRRLQAGLGDITPGHYDLDGEKLYLNCFDYETLPEADTCYEAHEGYGDIHVLLRGQEKVAVSRPDTLTLTEAQPENDCWLYAGEAEQTVVLQPGTFLVVFPGDAHRIKMQVSGPEQVRKAVFKFKL
jgi:YhcH/YjgK/YiaL family protein